MIIMNNVITLDAYIISLVQEKNVFSNDRASSIMPQAVRGEISGILHKLAHLILHEDL